MIVTGNVKNIKMGFTTALTNPSSKEARIRVLQLSINTPGIILEESQSPKELTAMRIRKFMFSKLLDFQSDDLFQNFHLIDPVGIDQR